MLAAPLPLLGRYHEFSVTSTDLAASVQFYDRLGFVHAPTTDAFPHRYGALTDGHVCIGLHARGGASPVLTFVRPDVAEAAPALEARGVKLSVRRIGSEVFNELGFHAACGQAVALLEARTYSPVPHPPPARCGTFAEISLPATDVATAQRFWEMLGFVGAPADAAGYARLSLTSDFLELALHAPQLCPVPMLVFEVRGLAELAATLTAQGLETRPLPGVAAADALQLPAPEGTVLLLRAAPAP
ncbi:MAG: hypothetical protein JOZ67_07570 [Gammaproteobacteria bacterium]|nr:hypothetical protein [Gammaproteobacteria bacterium]